MRCNCRLAGSIEHGRDLSSTWEGVADFVATVSVNQGLTPATCCLLFPSST
jgi:hypothetical protein